MFGKVVMTKMISGVAVGLSLLCGCSLFDGDRRVADWEGGKRAEVLRWFSENQFGVTPIGRPSDQVIGTNCVTFAGGRISIAIELFLPKGADTKHPVPLFVFGDHVLKTHAPKFEKGQYVDIPTNAVVSRGFALVRWNFNDVCPNVALYSDDLRYWPKGVIAWQACGNPDNVDIVRGLTTWGTLGAWAWGFSRVMDWIETRPELDAKRVAVVGHSRGGKTALWAGAQDERFAMVISNGSGCGGAKLNDFDCEKSEHINQILHNFPNWFCQNYARWTGHDWEIERDSDDLLRLIAPRLCYVASGSEDRWAGPAAEKEAWNRAHDLWEAYDCPERMGYHCHVGPHKLRPDDWEKFMDFAESHWGLR